MPVLVSEFFCAVGQFAASTDRNAVEVRLACFNFKPDRALTAPTQLRESGGQLEGAVLVEVISLSTVKLADVGAAQVAG